MEDEINNKINKWFEEREGEMPYLHQLDGGSFDLFDGKNHLYMGAKAAENFIKKLNEVVNDRLKQNNF